MKREIDMREISDGKLYGPNDLVKADCGDCHGCFACCQKMGQSIVLDPLDIYRLTKYLNVSFEQLLAEKIELNVVDGLILPNLKMCGTEERCAFLDENRGFVDCFRLEGIITMAVFSIFCRYMNVRKKIVQK